MDTNTTIRQDYEQTLIKIVRVLPHNRIEQLVDFARFLEAQVLNENVQQEPGLLAPGWNGG